MSNVVIRISLCSNHTNTDPRWIIFKIIECSHCEWGELEWYDDCEDEDCSVKDCKHEVWE